MHKLSTYIILSLLLTSCGFRPVYQKTAEITQLEQIKVAAPDNRDSQMLKAAIEDALYASGALQNEKYILIPNLGLSVIPLSIELDGTTQRYRLTATSNYVLQESGSGKILKSGSIKRFNSYNIAIADYSTYVASKDAKKLLLDAIAEELRLRLIDYFDDQKS